MPKFNANLTMLFNEVPFLDRFQAAAEAGFKGVEYLFPYAFDKDALAERLVKHGLVQVLHNLPASNWDGGERGPGLDQGAGWPSGQIRETMQSHPMEIIGVSNNGAHWIAFTAIAFTDIGER